ncbi:MAG: hypothetical protein U0Y68_24205 [Blastocatellia bacterium]
MLMEKAVMVMMMTRSEASLNNGLRIIRKCGGDGDSCHQFKFSRHQLDARQFEYDHAGADFRPETTVSFGGRRRCFVL